MSQAREKTADLLEDLESSVKPKVRAAVDVLIALAADSSDLRNTLTQLLTDPQRKNRWAVAYVLAQLRQPSREVTRILLDGLGHREPDIRWAIALLLIRWAKTDGQLVNRLVQLCAAGTSAQKRMAIYCLRDLNLTDPLTLQALLHSLQDSDPTIRVAAATSLKGRADIEISGRQALLDLFLNDSETRVRNAAAIALAQLGSPSEEFLLALKSANEGENAQLKKAAATALAILQNKRSAPSGS
jgi:HEAT repeat protein